MKILKWVGIVFALLVVIGILSEERNKNGGAQKIAESSQPKKKELYNTTAQQLFSDYEANEVATDEKIKGKLIAVSGVVQPINKDFTDSIVIALRTRNQFMPARLSVNDSQKQKAMELTKGTNVTIVCEKMRRIVGSPSGHNCEFK